MKALQLPNGEFYYEERGEGPALLFVHAGIADSRMWQPQVEAFAPDFRVITCDLRGYGRSLLPDGEFSYADDLAALLDHLQVATAWLVGASFGARVCVDFCLAYPERVAGMVLVSPVVEGFAATNELEAFGEREEALLDAGDVEGATQLNVEMWIVGPHRSSTDVDPAILALVTEMQRHAFLQPEPENVSLRKPTSPASERLGDIQIPVLVVTGPLDVATFLDYARTIVDQIPHAQQVVIPNTAHLPSLESPERFNKLVADFISTYG